MLLDEHGIPSLLQSFAEPSILVLSQCFTVRVTLRLRRRIDRAGTTSSIRYVLPPRSRKQRWSNDYNPIETSLPQPKPKPFGTSERSAVANEASTSFPLPTLQHEAHEAGPRRVKEFSKRARALSPAVGSFFLDLEGGSSQRRAGSVQMPLMRFDVRGSWTGCRS